MSSNISIKTGRSSSHTSSRNALSNPIGTPTSYKRQNDQLAQIAGSVRSNGHRTPRASFSSHATSQARPPASSQASMHSIDIDNPDPETVRVVGRHLVGDSDNEGDSEDDKFRSLRLQGGDITRQIYNWQREHEGEDGIIKRGRSRSFGGAEHDPPGPSGEALDARQMLAPGGFRREFITNKSVNQDIEESPSYRPTLFTRNFIEFLSLYGHYAGEDLEDEDEDDYSEEDESESTALLSSSRQPSGSRRPKMNRRLSERTKGTASVTDTVMLLLKSFVGTGILFLPRAFYNGGILFCTVVLCLVSAISYWCFLLLVQTKSITKVSSFGDIGGALYGNFVRQTILLSIVLSQIGFAAAYMVFVSENFRSFWHNIGRGEYINLTTLLTAQIIVFLPLSMIRDIAKLGFTALIADAFILMGIIYLYGWSADTILGSGVADVALFNSESWPLFIGTAIFTFEGIGLIIPIEESMKEPYKFPKVLAFVMVGITVVFCSIGALLYAATGSQVQTVILLNLPEGSRAVSTIQLLYCLAILLSTPLQLFPGIRIVENWIFVRSGKYNKKVKWEKNFLRSLFVIFTAFVAFVGANDLDKFVSLVGSFACVPLVYIYPPLLHMEVVPKKSAHWIADVVMLVFGVCIMAYTSWSTLASWL